MSLHEHPENRRSFIDVSPEDPVELAHKKHVRQMLEERLERKRLKEELEYFDGELDADFDWNYLDK